MIAPEETLVDASIGETRRLTLRDGLAVRLELWRWSEVGVRAFCGERFAARVVRIERGLGGAFLDLGLGETGAFLPLRAADALGEGALIAVEITREASRAKAAVAARLPEPPPPLAKPQRLTAIAPPSAPPFDPETRACIDDAVERALSKTAPIPGGGRLIVEPTAALTAIDVDAADRPAGRDRERFALELNRAAAPEALRQLRLRGLGGLAAIDFVSLRRPAHQKLVEQALRAALEPGEIMAGMSRFGVIELSRPHGARPLAEILTDEAGAPTPETLALAALRALQNATAHARGRVVVARLDPAAAAWLDSDTIAWRAALAQSSGPRFRLLADPARAGRPADIALEDA